MGKYNAALIICRVVTMVFAFTFHEFAHAWTAVKLGDDTPRRDGRLTLNPIRHIDPWGAILLIVCGFGWAKPVRVNQSAVTSKNRAGLMLVSAAGPLANLILALVAGLVLRAANVPNTPIFGWSFMPGGRYFLSQFAWINISLAVFNLIPLSPLDGEKVVRYFIHGDARTTWNSIQKYGRQILMVLFFVLPYARVTFAEDIVSGVSRFLYQVIIGG